MSEKKAKLMNKEYGGKKGRKLIQKEKRTHSLKALGPQNMGHSSKKRQKNEDFVDFKMRRRAVNKRKREMRKRYAQRT